MKWVKVSTTNVPHHIETSQLICNPNQLTGFYMMKNTGRPWVKKGILDTKIEMWDALYTIWYHLYNSKSAKNTLEECYFQQRCRVKPATLLKVILFHGCFSSFFILYKWYQIAQCITYVSSTTQIFIFNY